MDKSKFIKCEAIIIVPEIPEEAKPERRQAVRRNRYQINEPQMMGQIIQINQVPQVPQVNNNNNWAEEYDGMLLGEKIVMFWKTILKFGWQMQTDKRIMPHEVKHCTDRLTQVETAVFKEMFLLSMAQTMEILQGLFTEKNITDIGLKRAIASHSIAMGENFNNEVLTCPQLIEFIIELHEFQDFYDMLPANLK